MRSFAAFVRKVGGHVARRLGSTSASGGPLPRAAGRAAPGGRKVPAETRARRGKVAPIPASQEPLPGAAGKVAWGERMAQTLQSRVARLPPLARKAVEGKFRAETEASKTRKAAVNAMRSPCSTHGLAASTSSAAASTSTTAPPPPHPSPCTESDFWFKVMMAGGAAVAFVIDLLQGFVEKEVDLKIKEKDAQEKEKLIQKKDKELELRRQELEIATKGQGRGWFWQ